MKTRIAALIVAVTTLLSFSYSSAATIVPEEQSSTINAQIENNSSDVTITKLSESEIPEALMESTKPTIEASLAALKADPAAVVDAPAQEELVTLTASYAQEIPKQDESVPLDERYFGAYADLTIHIDESLLTDDTLLMFSEKNADSALYQGTADKVITIPAVKMNTGYVLTFTSKENGLATSFAGNVRVYEKEDGNNGKYLDIQSSIYPQIYRDSNAGISTFSYERFEVEPNDQMDDAMPMEDNDTRWGYIDYSGDVDFYSVCFGYDGKANFWLGNIPSGKQYDFYLYNSSGKLLSMSLNMSDQQQIYDFDVTRTETYYMRVSGRKSTDYSANYEYTVRARVTQKTYVDDYPNICKDAHGYLLNTTVSGRINYPGDVDVFWLNFNSAPSIETRKMYRVYTTGSIDTVGTLIEHDHNYDEGRDFGYTELKEVDQGGTGDNFMIIYSMSFEGGGPNYYVKVSGYGNTTGNYTLHFEELPDDVGDSFSTASEMDLVDGFDERWPVRHYLNTTHDVDYFKFRAEHTGWHHVLFSGPSDSDVEVYDANRKLISRASDNEYEDTWLPDAKCNLVEGEWYYLKVYGGQYPGAYGIQPFFYRTDDDWPDTFWPTEYENDLPTLKPNTTSDEWVNGKLSNANDKDCMKLIVYETGSYCIKDWKNCIKTKSGLDTACALYDSDKSTVLARSYSGIFKVEPGIRTYGFEMCLTLEGKPSGKTYYLEVYSESGDTSGDYKDYEVRVDRINNPNDTRFDEQLALLNKEGPDINVLPVWRYTKGAGMKIAVLDTGLDTSHPDLAANIAPGGYNFVHNSNNLFPSEESVPIKNNSGTITGWHNIRAVDGHGMHVAGIIGAERNNAEGIVGVAPEAKILPIKVLGSTLMGPGVTTSNAQNLSSNEVLQEGIKYAVEQGCNIINMSLQGYEYDQDILDYMKEHDEVLFVICAGNKGDEATGNGANLGAGDHSTFYPAFYNLPNTITVANNQKDGDLYFESNYGGPTAIAAPGTGILSTVPGNTYALMDGTSMATPAVSGAAALIWSWEPTLTAAEVKARLIDSRNVTYQSGYSGKVSSKGILNVWKAFSRSAYPQSVLRSVMNENIQNETEEVYVEPTKEEIKAAIIASYERLPERCKTNRVHVRLAASNMFETVMLETGLNYEIIERDNTIGSFYVQFETNDDAGIAVHRLNQNDMVSYAQPTFLIEL